MDAAADAGRIWAADRLRPDTVEFWMRALVVQVEKDLGIPVKEELLEQTAPEQNPAGSAGHASSPAARHVSSPAAKKTSLRAGAAAQTAANAADMQAAGKKSGPDKNREQKLKLYARFNRFAVALLEKCALLQ